MPKQTKKQSKPQHYEAALFPGSAHPLPDDIGDAVKALQGDLGMPVWLLCQDFRSIWSSEFNTLDEPLWRLFFSNRDRLKPNGPVALLLDSPGGQARAAYQVARLLRKTCGSFTVVIPRYAKSAATLLALGADQIIMGTHGELGPLDVQLLDYDKEEFRSALDEVQSLERLFASALDAVDQTMLFMMHRAGKKIDALLPTALNFVTEMMKPLVEKIDAVHLNQTSRLLKVAEEYASRLLQPKYAEIIAKQIARRLVEYYPEHGFIIDSDEAGEIGLHVQEATDAQEKLFAVLYPSLGTQTLLGPVERVTT